MGFVGRRVESKVFGIGTIIESDDTRFLNRIKVKFDDQIQTFLYPACMAFS